MKMPKFVQCKMCKKTIGEFPLKTFMMGTQGYDMRGKRRLFCNEECYSQYKKQFEVEIYNMTPIYMIVVEGERRFLPYWVSHYYFTSIEDCRNRIVSRHIGIPL